ncbi:MAG: hypothetical protein LBB08_02555, partial [Rickettsiales bacterium]|nr:hypothetical protein [Rickettsiales bacterium]
AILPDGAGVKSPAKCPDSVNGYLSKDSCEFLVGPIDDISAVNNDVIKKGFEFLASGLVNFMKPLGWGIKDGFLDSITGILLITTFFSSNMFMAMLIIEGLFALGLALILYPFKVLLYVMKDDDQWINPWPALGDLVSALKRLVVAMIVAAFMLLINVSIAGALFDLDAESTEWGGHSVTWLGCIMTFWILHRVFQKTREKLESYLADKEMTGFYDKVKGQAVAAGKNVATWGMKIAKISGGKP